MCQLLGLNANTPTDLVFSFTGFAHRAEEHKDGFGIAFFEGPGARLFVDAQSATQSPVAEMIRHYPIRSRHILAHIRKATQGHVALENCHPFVRELWGRYWVFAHNGNLVDFEPKLHSTFKPGGRHRQRARVLLAHAGAGQEPRIHALPSVRAVDHDPGRSWCRQVARHGTFNFMLSHGEALWVHCSTHLHYLRALSTPLRPRSCRMPT
jgi:predicted glutamine amidotransferase